MVEHIRNSARPMTLADKLLDQTGRKAVQPSELVEWYFAFVRRHGAPDPTFDERLHSAANKASQGLLSVKEFEDLKSVLNASWSPWAKDDRASHREMLDD